MDPFTTLGLPRRFELDDGALEARYRDLQRALHPDRHVGAPPNERRMSLSKAIEVNAAYRVLKSDLKRAEALLSLLQADAATAVADPSPMGAPAGAADPALLMEMMEQREALSDAKASGDLSRVQVMKDGVRAQRKQTLATLAEAFQVAGQAGGDGAPAALEQAREAVGRLKYYERFLDEVANIEDELL